MTEELLEKGIEQIDEKYIEEALEPIKEKKIKYRIVRRLSYAVAACLIIAISIYYLNISKTEIVFAQKLVLKGEYYRVYELKRDFGDENGKELEKQYQYVVFNGSCVLYSGLSMLEMPDIEQISENIVRVRTKIGDQQVTVYCDLRSKSGKSNTVVNSERLLFEGNEHFAYLVYPNDNDGEICNSISVGIKPMSCIEAGYADGDVIPLKSGAKNICANIKNDIITVTYNNKKGKPKKITKKMSSYFSVVGDIIKNEDEVKCEWIDNLVTETDEYMIYDISFSINREDFTKQNHQYQYFMKYKGKVIDGGYSKGEKIPKIEKIEGDITKVSYQNYYCWYYEYYGDLHYDRDLDNYIDGYKYYDNKGNISPEFIDVMYEKNRKVLYADWRYDYPCVILGDMFSGEDIKYRTTWAFDGFTEVKDFKTDDDFSNFTITYNSWEGKIKTKTFNFTKNTNFAGVETDKFIIRNDKIAKIWDQCIVKESISGWYFGCEIYNKDGNVIDQFEFEMGRDPIIKKITDEIVEISYGAGTNVWFSKYYNQTTGAKTDWIEAVVGKKDDVIVYAEYENDIPFYCVKKLFSNEKIIRKQVDKWIVPGTEKVKFDDDRIIIKHYSDEKEDYVTDTIYYDFD